MMSVKFSAFRHCVLSFFSTCCMLTVIGVFNLHSQETETSDREHPVQVDVISYQWPGRSLQTVDLRIVARNLHEETLYDRAFDALAMTGNVFLSSGTVKLLAAALNDDSHEVRQRAITLLGYSRNREAIDVITDSLQNDTSWRVRKTAAIDLAILAGEAAVPALKAVLAERPTEHSSRARINYYGNYGYHVTNGALFGLGYAGGEGIAILIQMLEDEIEKNGGKGEAMFFLECLDFTLDRRVIRPLIDIISHPAPPSDPNLDRARRRSAMILTRFPDEMSYNLAIQRRNDWLAKGSPMTPVKNRQFTPKDRTRIREALQNAGLVEYVPK